MACLQATLDAAVGIDGLEIALALGGGLAMEALAIVDLAIRTDVLSEWP